MNSDDKEKKESRQQPQEPKPNGETIKVSRCRLLNNGGSHCIVVDKPVRSS